MLTAASPEKPKSSHKVSDTLWCQRRLKPLFSRPIPHHPRAGFCTQLVALLGSEHPAKNKKHLDAIALAAELYTLLNSAALSWSDAQLNWTATKWLQTLGLRQLSSLPWPSALAQFFDADKTLGDHPIPETVLLLRGIALACDTVLGRTDTHPTEALIWLALAMELDEGPVSDAAWTGAFLSANLPAPLKTNATEARMNAARLFQTRAQHNGHALVTLSTHPLGPRLFALWTPHTLPKPSGAPFGLSVPPFDPQIAVCVDAVQQELETLLHTHGHVFSAASDYLFHQGGKRVRSLIVMGAAWACGLTPTAAAPQAALVELLHQSSLVLDDILDNSPFRRRTETIHIATSVPFAVGHCAWMLSRAVAGAGVEIQNTLSEAVMALIEGQRSEWMQQSRLDTPLAHYYRMVDLKTGHLFAKAAEIGGTVANADSVTHRHLQQYGTEVGVLFQIVDDLLDYAGDSEVLGKEVGLDYRTAKPTLPLLLLWERLDGDERVDLQAALDSQSQLAWVQQQMSQTGVFEDCRTLASQHAERARDELVAVGDSEGVAFLWALVETLEARLR
jgi:octaprenyl-diphosphate synthase